MVPGLEEEVRIIIACVHSLAAAEHGREDWAHYGDQLELAQDCLIDALNDFGSSWAVGRRGWW